MQTQMQTQTKLITSPNLEAADDFYEALIEAHQGLSTEESHAYNARLVLIMANQIGSLAVLRQALAAAAMAQPQDSVQVASAKS